MQHLPCSTIAEQNLIGSLLQFNEGWSEIFNLVNERDFFLEDHRKIFHHISKLLEMNKLADVVTVLDSIDRNHEGSATICANLKDHLQGISIPNTSSSGIREYAMIIREKALLRSLIETCEEIIRLANHPAERNAVRILDIANSRIFNIHETFCLLGNQGQPKKLEEVVGQAMLRIGAHHHTEIRKYVTGLETGFGDLDQVTSGIQRGDMVFLASRPGMGGITLALNMVQHIGLNLGYPVLIFNLECRSTLIASQLLSSRTEIDFGKLQYGELSLKEVELLTIESERLSKSNIFIDDNTILRKISDLRTRILFTLRKCKGLGLIVIDSFQKLTDSICNEYSNIDSAALLRTIKDIAKEISVPIIVLSDLSRSLENRKNKRPQLKDLRKAGINCQEADMVLMLYRDEYYKLDSEDRGIAEVHIQKNKNGPTGVVYLKSRLEFCKFEPLSK